MYQRNGVPSKQEAAGEGGGVLEQLPIANCCCSKINGKLLLAQTMVLDVFLVSLSMIMICYS